MKHIEQIQPEYAAFEISRLLVGDDDATATAALTRLLHDVTGCTIPQTSDLPESEVEELVPLCVSILRRHWQTPLTCLGDGTTPMSLADLLRQSIGDRVQGNEAWSIPPSNANIPTALTALRNRDMSSGLTLTLSDGTTTQAPDGISLAQLLCGSDVADTITELKDDNVGWTMDKKLRCISPTKVALCPEVIDWTGDNSYNYMLDNTSIKEYDLSKTKIINLRDERSGLINGEAEVNLEGLEEYNGHVRSFGLYGHLMINITNKVLNLPNLRSITYLGTSVGGNMTPCIVRDSSTLEEVYMPKMQSFYTNQQSSDANKSYLFENCPNIRKIVVGKLTSFSSINSLMDRPTQSLLKLIHFEIGEGTGISLPLQYWNPTTALAERLDEFLSNFKTYIAHRLTDKGSGLTLTLSPAVRDAIQQDPEIVSIITSKGWTISPAPSV